MPLPQLDPMAMAGMPDPMQVASQPQAQGQQPQQPKAPETKKDNPQLDELTHAILARSLGTARDFNDDETAYFRAINEFMHFAKQLGVDDEKIPDQSIYLSALTEAANLFKRTGRWDELKATPGYIHIGEY